MLSYLPSAAVLTALAGSVSAHGYVSGIVSGGKLYDGTNPYWLHEEDVTPAPGWYAYNQDHGFVPPESINDFDMACHKNATPGSTSVPVTAGSTIELQWSSWFKGHVGPILNYLACFDGDFADASRETLSLFKISEAGLVDGRWATEDLFDDGNSSTVQIPTWVNGNCVLRHELFSLHDSWSGGEGIQMYPQCVNLEITGGSKNYPEGILATELYSADDPGIDFNPYTQTVYTIPGPTVATAVTGGASSASATATASATSAASATPYSSSRASSAASASVAAAHSSSTVSGMSYSTGTAGSASASGYSTALYTNSSSVPASSSTSAADYSSSVAAASASSSSADYGSSVSVAAASVAAYSSSVSSAAAAASSTPHGNGNGNGCSLSDMSSNKLPDGFSEVDVMTYAAMLMTRGMAEEDS